jgi:hypothetical protein
MTSIKPPSGPITTLPHTPGGLDSVPASGLDASEPLQRTAELERTGDVHSVAQGHAAAEAASLEQVGAAGSAGGAHPVNLVDLARAVESGQLTMGQAVERLVEGTVGSLARQLSEQEHAELSELLRQAVANDPALSTMRDEQG